MSAKDVSFYCGVLEAFESGAQPNWNGFKARIDFACGVTDLGIKLLEPFVDEAGTWLVPFFALQTDSVQHPEPSKVFARYTPYKVRSCKSILAPSMDDETLRIFSILNEGASTSWRFAELSPNRRVDLDVSKPEDLFQGLVGMDGQKLELLKIAKGVKALGTSVDDSFHMVFTGNPGTGKTEIAQRLICYLDFLGITDGSRKFVKAGEADLVAKYVGHTAPKVRSVVESALGGLLFIDEAYAIASAPHFGQEAVDALVDQLDYHRGEFVCVMAGYPDQMDALMSMNPGLADRFGYRIDFPDYTVDELERIYRQIAEKRGFRLDCEDKLPEAMRKLRASSGFSNARSVRRLVKQCLDEAVWAHEDELKITEDDLCNALESCVIPEKHRIGF